MKRLLLVLVLLMSAGTLFAAELKITGDAYVRGTTVNNLALAEEDEVQYSYFDYDFNLNTALIVNENATVNMKLTYDKNVDGLGGAQDGDGTANDAALALERAYIHYKFAPFFMVDAGLMGGGTFGTTFNDNEGNATRLKFIGALSPDMIFMFIYQKNYDAGAAAPTTLDAENGDFNTYYFLSVMKFDAIKVMTLVYYSERGEESLAGDEDYSQLGAQLALYGDFGMFGFEAEFDYDTKENIDGVDGVEQTTMGAYINAFAKVDALKAGLVVAYGSADEEDGKFNFGDDFDMFVVMDDYVTNGGVALAGFTAFKLYADYKVDKITAMAAVGYGYNNADYEATEDATFMEFDLGASYAMDENTAYTVMLGYAKTSDFYVADVDADAWRLYHKLSVKF